MIEFLNFVVEQWFVEWSKVFVVYEVGYVISVKCQGMYDVFIQDSIEKWVIVWVISMGFIDDVNGVWVYGYLFQDYIDVVVGCC